MSAESSGSTVERSATRGVFLSYAREDTEPARRIADALSAFGVEVWFDQSELRGGDAWDAKIKRQIRDCTLFMPIISAGTQARGEGYFRREWKLAVERTHDMAAGVAFIVPVVIDDTPEADALAPEEFMRVQWSRLPHGVPSAEFIAQVKRLLERRSSAPARTAPPMPVAPAVAPRKKGVGGWTWGTATAVVVGITTAVLVSQKSKPPAAPLVPAAEARPAPVPVPAAIAPPKINEKSIAVLPFTNMSEEKDSAFFADGIHEDILTNLALVRELHVVSRTSVMQYRATTKSIRQIGEELGVAYILEGSVRRAGNKVRVTGQLINARTDEHAWAKAYDRDITDIFAIQAKLSQEIAEALAATLSPEEKSLLERRPTENLAAYDAYVKARQLAGGSTTSLLQYRTVEALLKKAVTLDPGFAVAWGELGRQQAFIYFNEVDRSPERLVLAREAIENAIRLAPDAPEVIEKYGDYFYYAFRDYTRAAEQYRRLAVLRPNDAVVFGSLGLIHRRQGRMRESLTELRRAVELEPRNMRYLNSAKELALALNLYEEATAFQQRVVGFTPGDLFEQTSLLTIPFLERGSTKEYVEWLTHAATEQSQADLLTYLRKQWALGTGDWAEARRLDAVRRYGEIPTNPHASQDVAMAYAFAAEGDQAAARGRAAEAVVALKRELEEKPSATAWSTLGSAYVLTGDREEALRCAHKAMELVPESNDSVAGPNFSLGYASVLAWTGDKDAALAELARLLRTPFGENIYSAKYSSTWWPLRGDPRFEKLVNDPANNTPLF